MRGRLIPRTKEHEPDAYQASRYQRACHYDAFVPDPVAGFDEPLKADTLGVVSDAEGLVRDLNAYGVPALVPLARLLLRTESIASCRVEGLQLDARSLAQAESRLDAGGRAGAQAMEILANIEAMSLAVVRAGERADFDVDDLVAIHRALMERGPHPQIAGVVRTQQNWIGGNEYNPCGAAFVPPPPEFVPGLLADLCVAVNENHLPPLVQAALVHVQFESIHPFLDGNGRTGRALVQVVLRRRRLAVSYVPPVSVRLAANKDRYIAGLRAFGDGDVDAWVEHFCVAMAQAAQLAVAYLHEVEELQQVWRARVSAAVGPRSDAAAWRVIEILPGHPVVSLVTATAATGRSRAVVNDALTQLETSGVLVRLPGGARNRLWEADGLLDLVSGLEDGVRPSRR